MAKWEKQTFFSYNLGLKDFLCTCVATNKRVALNFPIFDGINSPTLKAWVFLFPILLLLKHSLFAKWTHSQAYFYEVFI